MTARRLHKRSDLWFGLSVFLLVLFGLTMIYSAGIVLAETYFHNSNYYVFRQLIYLIIGGGLWIVFTQFDYHRWRQFGLWLFAASLLLMLPLALHLASPVNGAYRWYDLRLLNLQPTELLKIGLISYLAALFAEKRQATRSFWAGFLPFFAVLAMIALLVMRQPDLGTLLVIVVISCLMYFAAGARLSYLATLLVVLILATFVLIKAAPYRAARLEAFLNPSADSQNTGYHNTQALIAIGSGGLWGRGFGQSVQKHLYLPEPQTDSIFAVSVEELGFVRASLILLLFAIIAWRGVVIAKHAPDRFGQLLAVGLTTWIIAQAFLNIAAMLRLVPLTGVPLPFVSYGGSSLLAVLVAVGILSNISKQAQDG